MFNGRTNDFKVTDDGILSFPVFEEKFPSRTCIFSNVGEGIMNVEEIHAIILHKGAALARIRSLMYGLSPPSVTTSTLQWRSSSRFCVRPIKSHRFRPSFIWTKKSRGFIQ